MTPANPRHGKAPSGSERVGGRLWLVAATLLCAAHFATFDLTRQPIVTDVRYYLYFAARAAAGAVPHRDFFDNKTQLATFTGAALHRLGDGLGVDPLAVIRGGYLTLAALAGLLLFAVHRKLARDDGFLAFVGLLPYCGWALLGTMPSIGNSPKLLMPMLAATAALLAQRRRWLLAGAAGMLAVLDWQIGALALAGAMAAALLEFGRRLRATLWVVAGALLAAVPPSLFYLAHDALGAAFRQTVTASLARGSASFTERSFLDRLERLWLVTERGCQGGEWLLLVAAAGLFIFPLWLRRSGPTSLRALAVPLAIYHYGIVLYSLVDFQGYGDLFALLHSLSFFAGVAVVEVAGRLASAAARSAGPKGPAARRVLAHALLLAALVGAIRPSVLRPRFALPIRSAGPAVTLDDQRQVGRQLAPLVRGRKLAFVQSSEQLFLAGRANALPFIYWNEASWAYYRSSPRERPFQTWNRIVAETRPDVVVEAPRARLSRELRRLYQPLRLSSADGGYGVELLVRRRGL